MQQLEAQNDDLASTVETLKSELIASSEDAERASKELDAMRSRVLQDNAQESLLKDRELRETQSELEGCRMEKDEWEQMAMQEKMVGDEARSTVEALKRDLELERDAREREAGQLEAEQEQSKNLQSVLEDFQAGACTVFWSLLSSLIFPQQKTTSCGRLYKITRPSSTGSRNH